MANDPYTLQVALSSAGEASGDLYLDDGHSYDYTKTSAFQRRRFSWSGNTLTATEVRECTTLHARTNAQAARRVRPRLRSATRRCRRRFNYRQALRWSVCWCGVGKKRRPRSSSRARKAQRCVRAQESLPGSIYSHARVY
jgi:hypothetical protein